MVKEEEVQAGGVAEGRHFNATTVENRTLEGYAGNGLKTQPKEASIDEHSRKIMKELAEGNKSIIKVKCQG